MYAMADSLSEHSNSNSSLGSRGHSMRSISLGSSTGTGTGPGCSSVHSSASEVSGGDEYNGRSDNLWHDFRVSFCCLAVYLGDGFD
jgi:hypothetical protein